MTSVVARAMPGARIAQCATLAGVLAELAADDRAMVLLDLKLPDAEGFSGLLEIEARYPAASVAIVSGLEDACAARNAIVLGASGFIPKSASFDDMVAALHAIRRGETWAPTAEAPVRSEAVTLTPAQARILAAMQRGILNKQIAYEMGVTEATVKGHITIILRKLGVTNRTQAVLVARRLTSTDVAAP